MEDERSHQNSLGGGLRGAGPGQRGPAPDTSGVASAKSVTDLAKRVDKAWEGGIILKNSLFPTKMLLTEGDKEVAQHTVTTILEVPPSLLLDL